MFPVINISPADRWEDPRLRVEDVELPTVCPPVDVEPPTSPDVRAAGFLDTIGSHDTRQHSKGQCYICVYG